jgi:hypothetical protein
LLERLTGRVPDGVARALALSVPAGATEIELTDVGGLNTAGGDALELELVNSPERELVITAGYVAPLGGLTRAAVRLRTPVAFAHRAGTTAVRAALTFAPLGTLAREAQRGDRVLFASTLSGVQSEDVLRIGGATAPAELRAVRRLPLYDSATTTFSHPLTLGEDGSFTLPPIARLAQLQLFVEHSGQAVHPPVDLVPDYRGDNALQILFTP